MLIAVLENGIELVHQGECMRYLKIVIANEDNVASKTGDARMRLEKYLAEIVSQEIP